MNGADPAAACVAGLVVVALLLLAVVITARIRDRRQAPVSNEPYSGVTITDTCLRCGRSANRRVIDEPGMLGRRSNADECRHCDGETQITHVHNSRYDNNRR